jgi:hypothetical protein
MNSILLLKVTFLFMYVRRVLKNLQNLKTHINVCIKRIKMNLHGLENRFALVIPLDGILKAVRLFTVGRSSSECHTYE